MACKTLVPQPEIEPVPPALEAWSLNPTGPQGKSPVLDLSKTFNTNHFLLHETLPLLSTVLIFLPLVHSSSPLLPLFNGDVL